MWQPELAGSLWIIFGCLMIFLVFFFLIKVDGPTLERELEEEDRQLAESLNARKKSY